MTRIGLLVNPDAGLGGKLGLKGSDGQAEYARSQGAEDRAGPRVKDALAHFARIRKDTSSLQWVTSEGRMVRIGLTLKSVVSRLFISHQD